MANSDAQFVGRIFEIEQLRLAAHRAKADQGGILVIQGEPGIGKTFLLNEAERIARSDGAQVLRGSATELGQRLPFAAIGSALTAHVGPHDSLVERTRALLRGEYEREDGAVNHEFVIAEAIMTLIEQRCADGFVVLILDDLQWADPSSVLVLRRIAEVTAESPLLMVLAVRTLPRGSGLTGLLGELDRLGAQRLRLGPLSRPEVDTLVENSIGTSAEPQVAALIAAAGGHPLYLTELLAGLGQHNSGRQVTVTADMPQDPTRPALPHSLTETILRRLDFLPASARQLLAMAAALGPTIDPMELAAVLGGTDSEVSAAIDVATDGGLLCASETGFAFRHDLIHQVLAEQVPTATRATLHLRAAQVLMSMDALAERIATYLVDSTNPLDDHSLNWLVGKSHLLILRAPELAVTLLRRAVQTSTDTDARLAILRLFHVMALLWTGRAEEAEQAAHSAMAVSTAAPSPEYSETVRWLWAQACFGQGHLADAVTAIEFSLRQPGLTQREQGRLHGFRGLCHFFLEQLDHAEDAGKLALSIGESCDDAVAIGFGCMTLGAIRQIDGRLDEALRYGDRVIEQYHKGIEGQERSEQFDPYVLRAHCLLELDRLSDADHAFRVAVRHGGVYLTANLVSRARMNFLDGRWEDGLAEIRACLDAPDIFGFAKIAPLQAALIEVHRGTFTTDPATIPPLDDSLGSRGYLQYRPWVQALVYESQGQSGQALDVLWNTCLEVAGGMSQATLYHVYPDVTRLADTTGAHDIAHQVATAAEALAQRQGTPSRLATAQLCRGVAERQPALLAEAVRNFRAAGRPLYEGQAYESLAAILAETGQTSEAREALDSAVQLYSKLDAEWDVARAEARLRTYGLRRGSRAPRGRPKSGWAALTPTEHKVAAFVAQGLSNSDIAERMFLSRRTIQSHVSSILTKLNLRSRVQVAVTVTAHI